MSHITSTSSEMKIEPYKTEYNVYELRPYLSRHHVWTTDWTLSHCQDVASHLGAVYSATQPERTKFLLQKHYITVKWDCVGEAIWSVSYNFQYIFHFFCFYNWTVGGTIWD